MTRNANHYFHYNFSKKMLLPWSYHLDGKKKKKRKTLPAVSMNCRITFDDFKIRFGASISGHSPN